LEQARGNRPFWYVLLADQQSYFNPPPALLSTNLVGRTNFLGAPADLARAIALSFKPWPPASTNAGLARHGLIAELCVPGEAEPARQALSELVNGLKRQSLFSKVDLLSDDL